MVTSGLILQVGYATWCLRNETDDNCQLVCELERKAGNAISVMVTSAYRSTREFFMVKVTATPLGNF
jgi:hypothetical protein